MSRITEITLACPDDWHLHLRDGAALTAVLPHSADQFGRAIIMPNLKSPVVTVTQALDYRQRILNALPTGRNFEPSGQPFEPLMTLYLTAQTTPNDVKQVARSEFVYAIKWYPAGATTNSEMGLAKPDQALEVFAEMEKQGVPLLVHGEVTDPEVDIFDREKVFIETVLVKLLEQFPRLRIVLEHITTREAVEFVRTSSEYVAATITAHHLLYNRNDLLVGGIKPHWYCLPILKREQHKKALLEAAVSGSSKFFLGTDSAPHAQYAKEGDCGCAGCYTAFSALAFYAEAFERMGALQQLEGFASFYGADFYGLKRHSKQIKLIKESVAIPESLPYGEQVLIPLRAGGDVSWRVE